MSTSWASGSVAVPEYASVLRTHRAAMRHAVQSTRSHGHSMLHSIPRCPSRLQFLQYRTPSVLGSAFIAMAGVPDVPTTSAQEAGMLVLEQKAPYLDVRTPEEFSREHVPGSINVPWFLNLTTRQVFVTHVSSAPEMRSLTPAIIVVTCCTVCRAWPYGLRCLPWTFQCI